MAALVVPLTGRLVAASTAAAAARVASHGEIRGAQLEVSSHVSLASNQLCGFSARPLALHEIASTATDTVWRLCGILSF